MDDHQYLIDHVDRGSFKRVWDAMAKAAHAIAKDNGFWDTDGGDGQAIALMHSELSEALEALRHGNPPDDKIPEFNGAAAELADLVIRVMDTAAARGWDVGGAIAAKMEYNKSRPYRHGKRF